MRHDELLTSLKNPKVKYAASLRERKERDAQGVTLLEGYRELFRADAIGLKFHEVFYCPELFLGENEDALLDSLASHGPLPEERRGRPRAHARPGARAPSEIRPRA